MAVEKKMRESSRAVITITWCELPSCTNWEAYCVGVHTAVLHTVYVLHNNTKCALLLAVIAAEFNLTIKINVFFVGFLEINVQRAHQTELYCGTSIPIIVRKTRRNKIKQNIQNMEWTRTE